MFEPLTPLTHIIAARDALSISAAIGRPRERYYTTKTHRRHRWF